MQRGTTYGRISRRWRGDDGIACGSPITSCLLPCRQTMAHRRTYHVFRRLYLDRGGGGHDGKAPARRLVMGNTYRNPALVAKMATTLDQASKGRFTLGLGSAWFRREHEAYGWDFPSMKERQDRLEEACELIRKLFTADGARRLQRPVLPAGPSAALARLLSRTAHSDIGWRQRRASHIAHPGDARRHLQFQRLGHPKDVRRDVSEKLSVLDRRVGEALRGRRSRSSRDQGHDSYAVEPYGRQGICEAFHRNARAWDDGGAREITSSIESASSTTPVSRRSCSPRSVTSKPCSASRRRSSRPSISGCHATSPGGAARPRRPAGFQRADGFQVTTSDRSADSNEATDNQLVAPIDEAPATFANESRLSTATGHEVRNLACDR